MAIMMASVMVSSIQCVSSLTIRFMPRTEDSAVIGSNQAQKPVYGIQMTN